MGCDPGKTGCDPGNMGVWPERWGCDPKNTGWHKGLIIVGSEIPDLRLCAFPTRIWNFWKEHSVSLHDYHSISQLDIFSRAESAAELETLSLWSLYEALLKENSIDLYILLHLWGRVRSKSKSQLRIGTRQHKINKTLSFSLSSTSYQDQRLRVSSFASLLALSKISSCDIEWWLCSKTKCFFQKFQILVGNAQSRRSGIPEPTILIL
jgi:hypothetical protein